MAKKIKPTIDPASEWSEFAPMIRRMFNDVKKSSDLLTREQSRFLVDTYYQIQDYRIQAGSQVRQSGNEPSNVVNGVFTAMEACELGVRNALARFSAAYRVSAWAQSICGIGPVISAGFLAHLDIRKARTVGHFWRFAGLDPSVTWSRGTKRPWNASLKVLCWKTGESFIKVQSNANDFYGRVFAARKALEIERNDRGDNAQAAATQLTEKKIRKTTDCYKHLAAGHLPPAQVNSRARRYAVKLFLSHLHHVMHNDYYGTDPPVPFSFEHCQGDHRHFIPVPNWPGEYAGKGLRELMD